jgi:hypothetical protein
MEELQEFYNGRQNKSAPQLTDGHPTWIPKTSTSNMVGYTTQA